jgi:hypothetical protein
MYEALEGSNASIDEIYDAIAQGFKGPPTPTLRGGSDYV